MKASPRAIFAAPLVLSLVFAACSDEQTPVVAPLSPVDGAAPSANPGETGTSDGATNIGADGSPLGPNTAADAHSDAPTPAPDGSLSDGGGTQAAPSLSVAVTNITATSARVSWTPQNAPLLTLAAAALYAGTSTPPDCKTLGFTPVQTKTGSPSGFADFTGLAPLTTYSSLVCVLESALDPAPLHAAATFTTSAASTPDAGPPKPLAPTFDKCTALDTGPRIHWASAESEFWLIKRKVGFEPTSCTDSGATLLASHNYLVSGVLGDSYVVWICAKGPGGVSAPLKVLVNEPLVAGGLASCLAQ